VQRDVVGLSLGRTRFVPAFLIQTVGTDTVEHEAVAFESVVELLLRMGIDGDRWEIVTHSVERLRVNAVFCAVSGGGEGDSQHPTMGDTAVICSQ
jgi:hypothetical protein